MEIAPKPYTMSHFGEWGSRRKEILVLLFLSLWPHYIFNFLPTFHWLIDLLALLTDGKTETGSQSSDTWATYFPELPHDRLSSCCFLPNSSGFQHDEWKSLLTPQYSPHIPHSGFVTSVRRPEKLQVEVMNSSVGWDPWVGKRGHWQSEVPWRCGNPREGSPCWKVSCRSRLAGALSQLHASLPESPVSVLTMVAWNQPLTPQKLANTTNQGSHPSCTLKELVIKRLPASTAQERSNAMFMNGVGTKNGIWNKQWCMRPLF